MWNTTRLLKYMDANKAHLRRNFPRGHVHIIEDYAENGELGKMKKEHGSRYFDSRPYSLFGMAVESHVEDRLDLTGPEKARLIAILDKHRPDAKYHIITEMYCVVSEDCQHDPAAVQYFNDTILIPHLSRVIAGLTEGGVMHYCCDGAPTQFDNTEMYLWVSKCWQKHKIKADYVIGCANHNKDVVDGEQGHFKNAINRVNNEHDAADATGVRQLKIDTVAGVHTYLESHMTKPQKTLEAKKGHGMYRRIFHHVPLKTIGRRLPAVKTLKGSKPIHQFVDVGVPGKLLWRRRPCHVCDGCLKCDPTEILRCPHHGRCGKAKYVTIKTTAPARAVITRSSAVTAGVRISSRAVVGDFLVVDVADVEEHDVPWLLGEVTKPCFKHTGGAKVDFKGLAGVKNGDDLVALRRWDPMETGGG